MVNSDAQFINLVMCLQDLVCVAIAENEIKILMVRHHINKYSNYLKSYKYIRNKEQSSPNIFIFKLGWIMAG